MIICKRLKKAASLVKKGSRVADIGTDHAKLPVLLIQQGVSPCCIASDIMQGPLDNALKTVQSAGVQDKIDLRLCDGLEKINENEVDTIVIAGMGGEMIIKIISDTPWCKNKELILQPMTAADKLRAYLSKEGFLVKKEVAVTDMGKHYCLLSVIYDGVKDKKYDKEYLYVGNIYNDSKDSQEYLNHQIKKLNKIKTGLINSKQKDEKRINDLDDIINAVSRRLEK